MEKKANMKNVLIIGLGAVGTCVASRFLDSGMAISALCDADRKARYEKDDFIINGKKYVFDYVTADSYGKKADLVIVCTKYHSLKDSIQHLNDVIDENTVVLSILNGIDSEEIIGDVVGKEKVLYGYIYRTDATKVDNVCNFEAKEIIAFGEKSGEITSRVNAVADLFEHAGILVEAETDILTSMWWKYMLNIGMNQTSCVSQATYGVYANCEHTWALAKAAMQEAVKVANAKGIALDKGSIDRAYAVICKLNYDGKTSMLQDVVAKRKTEVEMLAEKLCDMGEKLGIETPVNRMLLNQIKTIEFMY